MNIISNYRTILCVLFAALLLVGCELTVQNPENNDSPTSDMKSDAASMERTVDDVTHGPLLLQHVWSRPSFTGGMGAIYMNLTNSGDAEDRLIRASTEVAAIVEIHEVIMENDVMQMKLLPNGLTLPMGEQIDLKPGGYHVMLFDLQQDLNVGDIYSVTLEFEESGAVDVPVKVLMP